MKSACAFATLLLLVANLNTVRAQNYCVFDFNVYYNAGYYTSRDFSQWWTWKCQDSYVVVLDKTKVVTIDIDPQINCQTNNLVLTDSNFNRFDFCSESLVKGNKFTTRNAAWIKMQKTKKCAFCVAPMSFSFQIIYTNADIPTTPKPKPTTTTPKPTTTTPKPTTTTPKPTTRTTTEPPVFPKECGRPAISPLLTGLKIVNGISVNENSWPWQVLLETSEGGLCGGSLINDQWVITAAHCKASKISAFFGVHDYFEVTGPNVQVLSVDKFINHPQYDNVQQTNDIALIKLASPVKFTQAVSPICMPDGRQVQIGDKLIVTGWGATAEGAQTSNILLQTDVSVNDDSVCTKPFDITPLISSQLCAGIPNVDRPHDSCQGDSGGPLVKREANGQFWLAGVVSTGVGCGGNGIYSRVSTFERWISETIRNNVL